MFIVRSEANRQMKDRCQRKEAELDNWVKTLASTFSFGVDNEIVNRKMDVIFETI